MTQRFTTYFGTVFLIHAALLISGLTLITQEHALRHYGKRMLTVGIARELNASLESVRLPVTEKPKALNPKLPAQKVTEAPVRPGDQPVATASALSGTALADIKTIYFSELRARIDENKFYPAIARRLQQQGEPIVGFTLLPDGTIIDVRIAKSSANARLDEAALAAVRAVKKFKPLPKEIGESRMDFEIPVKFQLL